MTLSGQDEPPQQTFEMLSLSTQADASEAGTGKTSPDSLSWISMISEQ